jgi:acetyl-CoA carboxylase biotin carboxyl carrier protein
MNLEEIRNILDLVTEHDLGEFELEIEGLKIKVKKSAGGHLIQAPGMATFAPLPAIGLPAAGGAAPAPRAVESRLQPEVADAANADLAIVTSPIVGTFYRASEPAAPPFVEKGAQVKKGQVLCIIEAMKLMNEIECDYDGEIVAIYLDNGRPVQYGERLFAIKVK